MAFSPGGSRRRSSGKHRIISVVLPNGVHPDGETVAKVQAATITADALIAVGSGTINDLSKYASAQDGKPYAVFATAPSMNGYTSVNAAITMHGHKMSLPAQAPLGAFFDLSILSAAPPRLVRAGLGDSLCRTTSQADWLLAHLLFDLPYRQLPYDLLADDEPALFANSAALLRGDKEIMERPGSHADPLGVRHRDRRQQPAGEPGRASHQPLHRHVRRSRAAADLSRRAGRRDDALDGAAAGNDAGVAAGGHRGYPDRSGFSREVRRRDRQVVLGRVQQEAAGCRARPRR